jgi:hypothetical protein
LTNERIDLPQRQRHRWTAFKIAADRAIGWDREIEGGLGRVFDDGWVVFLHQTENATDAADTFVAVDVIGDGARFLHVEGSFTRQCQRKPRKNRGFLA